MLGLVLNKVDMSRLRLYDSSAEYYDARRYANYLLKGPLTDRAAARSKSAVR